MKRSTKKKDKVQPTQVCCAEKGREKEHLKLERRGRGPLQLDLATRRPLGYLERAVSGNGGDRSHTTVD